MRLLPALLLLAAHLAAPASAQEAPWPSRPITLLAGFPNTAGTEVYLRRLAEPLSRALGVPMVVDNRSGAGGNIANEFVARARPDGYLFLIGTAGTHAINPALYAHLTFDALRDFTHIIMLGDVPNMLLVNPERRPQYRTCTDVIAAARARPGAISYSSTGNGASTHLAGAQFAAALGLDLLHVPYRGQPGAMQALLAGDVDLFFNQTGPSIGPVQQGQLRALAVTAPAPIPALPQVPTMATACGLPGFETSTWYGLFAPPRLPEPILRRMNGEIARIIRTPEFERWLVQDQGITPPAELTPEGFRRIHERDLGVWAEIVRRSGAKVD